jgi:hypothetical protein
MTINDVKRIFVDSLRLYFAPLRGAFRGAKAESQLALTRLRKNSKDARSSPPSP